jgi:hypothetical protein
MAFQVPTVVARFRFQHVNCGGIPLGNVITVLGNTLRENDATADFALLTVFGNPQAAVGVILPTTKLVAPTDAIWITQHPGGIPKVVSWWADPAHTMRCRVGAVNGNLVFYNCDTNFGSSGSPVTSAVAAPGGIIGEAVGLHSNILGTGRCPNQGFLFGTATGICAKDVAGLLKCVPN